MFSHELIKALGKVLVLMGHSSEIKGTRQSSLSSCPDNFV
jgi:hypothetical protein